MIQTWLDSKDAVFFVGFVLGALCLALLTSIFRALRQNGVRALKRPLSIREAWGQRQAFEVRLDLAASAYGSGSRWGSANEVRLTERMFLDAHQLWVQAVLQSANAGKSQTAEDSQEERQRLKQQ